VAVVSLMMNADVSSNGTSFCLRKRLLQELLLSLLIALTVLIGAVIGV
jgi:hypothetical protein